MPTIAKLDNPIQAYAWGSLHAIAEFQGRPTPALEPEAELWIGDHPRAPSRVLIGDQSISLPDWIASDPEGLLGPAVRGRHGDALPFLVKLLAVARPLSIQVHPDSAQAREGYAREQRRRVPLDSRRRSYCDPNPKHEILIPLTPFSALCGFRDDAEVLQLIERAAGPTARPLLAELETSSRGRHLPLAANLLHHLLEAGGDSGRALCRAVREHNAGAGGTAGAPADWVCRLHREYPEDATALAPLLLHFVPLKPGQALVVRPGTVHCYLEGFGVEVMTRSDNVVRAGLTSKHIDVEQLVRLVSARAAPPEVIEPEVVSPTEVKYRAAAPEFEVTEQTVCESHPAIRHTNRGPRVLLCVRGQVVIESDEGSSRLELRRGEAALLPACVREYGLRGSARVFSVTSEPAMQETR